MGQENIYRADGTKVGMASGRTRLPIIVIDTVRLDDGYAKIELNSAFGAQGVHNVTATASGRLIACITQILDSNVTTISHSYKYRVTGGGQTFEIASDSLNDSSLVSFIMILN